MDKLLKALALQIGSAVSYNELSNMLQIDKATVAKYIDLLEKAFIVFRLNSFSRNQRNEIKNNRIKYKYDKITYLDIIRLIKSNLTQSLKIGTVNSR